MQAKSTEHSFDSRKGGGSPAILRRFPFEYPALLLALALVMLTILQFIENQKWLILICCLLSALIAGIVLFGKGRRKPRLFFLLYAAYLLWLGLGVFWAVSGRFFLREYSKQLFVLPLMLFIFFLLPRKEASIRKLLFLLSAVGAFYAILSIDNATAGLSHSLLYLIPGFREAKTGYEAGTRLFGVFANGNISAGILAICIILSLYLLESSENRRQRVFAVIFAAFQAGTFLLNFSLGATGFFLLSMAVYLIFAGKRRFCVFLRMLEIALPVLVSVFLSFRFFEVSDSRRVLPLVTALLSAAVSVLLELVVFPRLSKALEGRRNRTATVFVSVLVVVCAYIAAGLLTRGDAELTKGDFLRRSCYPPAGDYTLSVAADGNTNVRVVSQNELEVVMHTQTSLYSGAAADASFTVPEDALVVYLTFTSPDSAVLHDVTLHGAESVSLHLGYPLLPGFIANRLQGLRANENAIQRGAFFRDGMKIFRDYPVLGAGLGSFESLLFGYQEFYYETKYVHNHYIQVLLDSGIIGLVLYLSLLLLTVAALWRGRKEDAPYRSLHPALCAAFVMVILHSSMEVVMSTSLYLPFACTVLGLSTVCYAPVFDRKGADKAAAAIPGLTALVYAVLIVLNLSASVVVEKSTNSVARFFSALKYAASVDTFEKNDWKVSYINTCADLEISNYRLQAEKYADQLIDVPSNSLHPHLISYYLVFREYDKALQAAKNSVRFNSSDSENWNTCFYLFSSASSLYPDDSTQILNCVRELNGDLQNYQEHLLQPIELDTVSKVIIAAAEHEE